MAQTSATHGGGRDEEARSGRIIVTASNAGIAPEPLVCCGYIAAKAAVINVVRQAALELAPYGVNVDAIAPGPLKTRIAGGRRGGRAHVVGARGDGPDGRHRGAEGLALLLAPPAASFITGTTTVIDGGMLLGPAAAWREPRAACSPARRPSRS